jgi:dihydroorotase-like cyclic amidohydrolase
VAHRAMSLDLAIRHGSVVFPGRGVRKADIGVAGGKIVAIADAIQSQASSTIDASGKLVFPGIIDSHFHLGIYRPLAEDAASETASAVAGGVTAVLVYHRAGRNNLLADTKAGLPPAYRELLPDILGQAAGNFWCDYGFNVAPVTTAHVREIEELVERHGVTTFKYYMHYRGVYTNEQPRAGEKEYVFSDSGYDLGHLKATMENITAVNRSGQRARLSIHAEHPALIREHTRRVRANSVAAETKPLQLYSRSRPPSSERLGILIAAELGAQTGCPLNVLHVSSADALAAIRQARRSYPDLDIVVEATAHHLSLSSDEMSGTEGKVNPPIRSAADRDELWRALNSNEIQTVVSDHAAISREAKGADVWDAWYGFGGTELLLPVLFTYGHVNRGVPLERIADVTSRMPAQYHGLAGRKGDILVGNDADLAICDPTATRVVDHRELHSAQDFSPFDGQELCGWVRTTILRGSIVYDSGKVLGRALGTYLARPL